MEEDLITIAMEEWLEGNLVKAEELLIEAAAAGSGHAAHNLGTLYATGGSGIEKDIIKSNKYYEQALESGFEETVASDPLWFRK